MSTARRVQFELHIRPMFRKKDRDKMLWAFDLWNYEDVRSNASNILNRIKVDMPPATHGGIWPQEWIELFERWINEGFSRLEFGTAAYSASLDGEKLTVVATGDYPTDTHNGWFQITESSTNSDIEFEFFFESQEIGSAPGFPFSIEEEVLSDSTVTQIRIRDSSGTLSVPVSSV